MDLNDLVWRIDFDALVEQTDVGAVIAASSSRAASDVKRLEQQRNGQWR
jgi:hypothetical protein